MIVSNVSFFFLVCMQWIHMMLMMMYVFFLLFFFFIILAVCIVCARSRSALMNGKKIIMNGSHTIVVFACMRATEIKKEEEGEQRGLATDYSIMYNK